MTALQPLSFTSSTIFQVCKKEEPLDRLSARFRESCNGYKYEDKIQEQSKTATRIQCNERHFQNKLDKTFLIFSSTYWAVAASVTFLCFFTQQILPYSITSESAHHYDHLIFSPQRFLNMFKMLLFLYFLVFGRSSSSRINR